MDTTLRKELLEAFEQNEQEPTTDTVERCWSLLAQIPKELYQRKARFRHAVISSLRRLLEQGLYNFSDGCLDTAKVLANHMSEALINENANPNFEKHNDDELQFDYVVTFDSRIDDPDDFDDNESLWSWSSIDSESSESEA